MISIKIASPVAKVTGKNEQEFFRFDEGWKRSSGLQQKFPDLLASASTAQNVKYRLEGYLFPSYL